MFLIGKEYATKIIPLINEAKRNINIAMYDWRWYEDSIGTDLMNINLALARASRRGVVISAVLDKGDYIHNFRKVGIKAKVFTGKRVLHSKFVIIDDEILIVGSHNLTNNAFTTNIESSVITRNPVNVERFLLLFRNLYSLSK